MSNKLAIYAKGDSFDSLHTMVGLVSTAASMGWEAHVYMTYGVLWRFCDGSMTEAEVAIRTPEVREKFIRGIDSGRIPDLDELFTLKSYDELEKIVNDWLNGDDNEDDTGTEMGGGTTTSSTSSDSSSSSYKSLDDAFADLESM